MTPVRRSKVWVEKPAATPGRASTFSSTIFRHQRFAATLGASIVPLAVGEGDSHDLARLLWNVAVS